MSEVALYRNASLIRNRTPLGPYHSLVPMVLEESEGGGRFLMGKVPLQVYVQTSRAVAETAPRVGGRGLRVEG